ncbi:MAG: excinuclease ABC subunit UvrC [bacterium]
MVEVNKDLKEKLDNLPKLPGCYIYKDKESNIIYVGKAKRLKDRVSSYFNDYDRLDPKRQLLVDTIFDLDTIVVDTEAEALILETNLIKKYHPKFNRMMMDDKNYSWIKITTYEDFPRILIARKLIEDGSDYFGPYPETFPSKDVLKKLRKIFPYRSCHRTIEHVEDIASLNNTSVKEKGTRKTKIKVIPYLTDTNSGVHSSDPNPCLYYHLGLCKAPCAAVITKLEYRKSINNIKRFLKGQKNEILTELESEMQLASKEMKYEKASLLRDRINNVKYVLNQVNLGSDVDDVVASSRKNKERSDALESLFKSLNLTKEFEDKRKIDPNTNTSGDIKIECYDISNIQGTNPVGSMVVFVNGQSRPDLYRKFKIRTKDTPDDFAMMKEMLSRRFKRINKEDKEVKYDETFSILPDLVIIDGGKGQLNVCDSVLKELGLQDIPHVGLAKREEEIFINKKELNIETPTAINSLNFDRVKLPKRSDSLKLVQRIRDETHRYGITFHRKLRSKKFLEKKD